MAFLKSEIMLSVKRKKIVTLCAKLDNVIQTDLNFQQFIGVRTSNFVLVAKNTQHFSLFF